MILQRIAFGWHGLPMYAARLLRAGYGACGRAFPIVATKPTIPIVGMEDVLQGNVIWIDEKKKVTWRELGLVVPDVYFQPTWAFPAFNDLGDEVRRNGGDVVLAFDNNLTLSARQILGAAYFRTVAREKYAAAWVAGRSGVSLAKFWGFEHSRIFSGFYGSDPNIFRARTITPLSERPKRFLFVGRLVREKGVEDLIAAFKRLKREEPAWELHVYGQGPLKALIAGDGIVFHDFQQPEQVADAMLQARFLVLPSHVEHWGLVVCEAAQCGCGLILSDSVGSSADFAGRHNATIFKTASVNELHDAMKKCSSVAAARLLDIERESKMLGAKFTPDYWSSQFLKILRALNGNYSTV